jgi:hypothetical protein
MTEQEYIDATNLAKVRSAAAVLRGYINTSPGKCSKYFIETMKNLYRLNDQLESIVETTE